MRIAKAKLRRYKKNRHTKVVECMSASSVDKIQKQNYGSKQFVSACLDIGSQRTVWGLKQAKAYCSSARIPLKLSNSMFAFKFGDSIWRSLGKLEFRIPLSTKGYLTVEDDVVDSDVPLLIGL